MTTNPDSVFYQPPRKVTLQLLRADYDNGTDVLTVCFQDAEARPLVIEYHWAGGYDPDNLCGSPPQLTITIPPNAFGAAPPPQVSPFMVAAIFLGRMETETTADDSLHYIDAAMRLADQEMLIDLLV